MRIRPNGQVLSAIDAVVAESKLKGKQRGIERRLANALKMHEGGKLHEAEVVYRDVLRSDPKNPSAMHLLGCIAEQSGRHGIAVELISEAITLAPNHPVPYFNLGSALFGLGQKNDAVRAFRTAIGIEPGYAAAWGKLGVALVDLGRRSEAEEAIRRSIELDPADCGVHANLIFALDLDSRTTAATAYAERRGWADKYIVPHRDKILEHTNDPDPERRLIVGLCSGDFCQHSAAASFQHPILGTDREQFQINLYSMTERDDPVRRQFAEFADVWRDVRQVGDDDLATCIREDKVDILVDLSAFSAGNRLPVFGRKPAPIQITGWGYATGTNIDTIDYLYSDPIVSPPDDDWYHVEEVAYLPSVLSWAPPPYDPAVYCPGPMRALQSGKRFTFGHLGRLHKVTDESMELWAKILGRLPESRLMLKANGLQEPETQERVWGFFRERGVEQRQIGLFGQGSHGDHLLAHHIVDLVLDTVPQTMGITGIESLWMGIPAVTLLGARPPCRIMASFMTSVGMPGYIARTPEEYIEIAVHKATHLDELKQDREGLRERFLASPICDGSAYAKAVGEHWRAAWKRWCVSRA